MNGLDDLRRTLDDEAAGLVDHELGARAAAIHHRVAVVRRRRRALAAGAVVGVVVVAAGVALATDTHSTERTDDVTTVVGVPAPDVLHSLGFTYRVDRGVDGSDGKVSVELASSPRPRLVSWATSGDDQQVTVDGPTLTGPTTFDVADFADFTYVPPGTAYTVKVTASSGVPGLAVYTLDSDRPAGVSRGGVTFPDAVPGATLLAARIGDVGQSQVTVPATATGRGITFHAWCVGGPKGAVLHVEYLDPKAGSFDYGSCDATPPVDGSSVGTTSRSATRGEDVGVRLSVTDGIGGPSVVDPDLRLGLATYALAQDPFGPTGAAPDLVTHSGHAWRRVDLVRSRPGQARLATAAPAGRGPVLAVLFGTGGDDDMMVTARVGDAPTTGFTGNSALPQVMADGDAVVLRATHVGRGDGYGVAFYVEDD